MQPIATFAMPLAELMTDPRTAVLLLLLLWAAVVDARSYRIPNAITLPGALLGLAISTMAAPSALSGFMDGLGGLATGLLCLMPLHALRLMGAGDVKLMAAAGAFLGLPDVLPAIFFVVVTGGIAGIGYALVRGLGSRLLANVSVVVRSWGVAAVTRTAPPPSAFTPTGRLPYGVCIFVGTAAFLVVRQSVS